jgi:hypothetical protein
MRIISKFLTLFAVASLTLAQQPNRTFAVEPSSALNSGESER